MKIDVIVTIIGFLKNKFNKVEKVNNKTVSFKDEKNKKPDIIIDADYKVKDK